MKRKLIKALVLTSLLAVLAVVALAFGSCSHSHMLTDVKVIKAATCTEEGEMEAACECGYVQKSTIPSTEHLPGAWEVTKQPTCTEAGSKKLSCRTCGAAVETAAISARSHDLVSIEAKSPTCSELGHNAYEYCTACDYTTYSAIDKKSHTPGAAATCTAPQYCRVCEMPVSEPLGHVRLVTGGTAATCTKTGTSDKVECTRCHTVIEESVTIPKRQHVLVVIPGTEPTCTEKGLSDSLVCLVCDKTIADAVALPASGEHNFKNDNDKTCDNDGCSFSRLLDCEHGEIVEDKDGEEEEESWVSESKGKDASCSRYGYSSWSRCDECGEIIEPLKVIEPLDHKLETVKGTVATLTTPGLTDGLNCKTSTCRNVIKQQELIPVISIDTIISNTTAVNGGSLSYKANDDTTCTVTGIGSCTGKDIVIPEYIDGLRVTAIGEKAFYSNTSITSVTVPSTVTEIGEKAFSACTKLTSVSIPDGAELEDDVFYATSKVEVEFTHTLIYVPKVTPESCDEPGVYAHYICAYCCNRYSDKEAKNQIYDVEYTMSHDFDDDGSCEECHVLEDKITIFKIYSVPTVKADKGTYAKDLELPATVTAVVQYETNGGEEREDEILLKVIWELEDYDGSVAGKYTATGHVCFGMYKTTKKLEKTVTAEIEVK